MVQADKSGWLVQEISDRALLVKLEEIINENSFQPLRDSTQSHAKNLFNEELIADQYYKLFKSFSN